MAFAFSPTLEGLIAQVKMLAGHFKASVVFIHVGVPLPEQMKIFANLLEKHGFKNQEYKMVFREGDVQSVIWDVCAESKVDLLVSGALRKESPERQYFGSIARGLAGNPKGPVLLIPEAKVPARPINTIIANLAPENFEQMIGAGISFAKDNNISTLYLVKESIFKSDPMVLQHYSDKDGFDQASMLIVDIEYAQIHEAVNKFNHSGLKIHTKVVFGLPGSGIVSLARDVNADLIIDSLSSAKKGQPDLDYPGGIEVILMNLPCNFLLFN